jgi:hypothetical protein
MAREAREGNEGFLIPVSRIDTNCGAKRPGVRRQAEHDAALGEMMIVGTRMLCGRWFKSGVAATAVQDGKRFGRGWARADRAPPANGTDLSRIPHSAFRIPQLHRLFSCIHFGWTKGTEWR